SARANTSTTLIVAPLARGGSVLHVARLPLAPGSHSSSPPLARSSLPRSLAVARCSMSLGCPSLQGRTHPRHRSLAHRCPARSRWLGAPCRSAAPRSRVALILATARSLIVAPLARGGSVLHVARLPLAPGSHSSSPPLARSSLPRSLAVARCSMSLGCPSLQGRTR